MATQSNEIQLGSDCPPFQLKGVDSRLHSREDYKDSKILIVAFTCNHCPYVKAYEDRINQLTEKFKTQSVSVVCINANDPLKYPDDSFENMVTHAQEKKFVFDYLHDATQATAKAFNAACTPEFYLYDEKRKLRYHGRLDDNTNEPQKVKDRYLELAISSVLAGKNPEIAKTPALGCGIKWR